MSRCGYHSFYNDFYPLLTLAILQLPHVEQYIVSPHPSGTHESTPGI